MINNNLYIFVFILLINIVHSYVPTEFFILSDEFKLVTINSTSGELLKSLETPDNSYYVNGFLSSNSTDKSFRILVTNIQNNDQIIEYSVPNNVFTPMESVEPNDGCQIVIQPYAYDPVHKIAAVVGSVPFSGQSNVTLCIWDFASKSTDIITLNGQIDFTIGYPEGAYDPSTGNYYILYFTDNTGSHLTIYNLLSRKVVGEYFFAGLKFKFPEIVFGGGRPVLIDTQFWGPSFKFYTVDLETQTYQQFLEVPTSFSTNVNISPVAWQGDYITFVTSTKINEYTFTTLDLNTLKVVSTSPVSKLKLPENSDTVGIF